MLNTELTEEYGASVGTFLMGVFFASMVYTYFMGRAGIEEIGFMGSGIIFGYWQTSTFWIPVQLGLFFLSLGLTLHFVRE